MQARPYSSERVPATAAAPAVRSCRASVLVLALLVLADPTPTRAQDIEPRAFSNAPVGVNFLIAGYAFTSGGLSFDPAVPVSNAELETSNVVLAYARVLDVLGMSGKFQAILPFASLSGSARFAGLPVEREVDGFGDAQFRVSVNVVGAPALTLAEFASYEQDLIVGASLLVTVPTGQYDPTRVVNLGANRWSFKPEIGVSQAIGPVTLELTAGVTVFTDNDDFLNGHTRSQNPLYVAQGHVIYSFGHGIWASADVSYLSGGSTTIDDLGSNDLQRNWRVGATLSVPLGRDYSLRLYGSRGVSARTGNEYDLIGLALQYRWGGGL